MGSNICLKLLITSILLTISCSAQEDGDTTSATTDQQQWNDYKAKFNKPFGSESEEQMRKPIFIENLKKKIAQNELYANGKTSFTAGTNQFSDMTYSEFLAMMSCNTVDPVYYDKNFTIYNDNSTKFPKSVDWRTRGYVIPVKDQGLCRACWAFASTGALEARYALETGRCVPLSEQQLIDCSRNYRNNGCNGGAPGRTFSYISYNGGINSEATYPYEGIDGACRFQRNATAATCDGFAFTRGEKTLTAVVANVGPVAVAMFLSESFKNYAGGIFNDDNCTGALDHAVLIVGFGTDNTTGIDYWIIKNSWGTTWGMEGYALIARNKEMCGIGYFAIYPVLF